MEGLRIMPRYGIKNKKKSICLQNVPLRSNNGGKKNWPIPRLMVKLTLAVGNPNIIHIIRFKGIDWIASRKTAARIQQTYS